ncbi:MAG: thioesterase family protein [Acidimicrobiia bacterium]|nr:thioesterase family protein [Acidimicrobiia bacterium]
MPAPRAPVRLGRRTRHESLRAAPRSRARPWRSRRSAGRRLLRALWVRLPQGLEVTGAALAILGDFVPFGIGQALGVGAGGKSLDNTLRVVSLVPTEWVLLDVHIHAISRGFGHGRVHLWSEDGTLLAIASQSAIVRYWK